MGRGPGRSRRVRIELNFAAYPVQSSLGVLGRKWALLILMKIALQGGLRFNELLRTTPGMSKRILALRLQELEREGFLVRGAGGPPHSGWGLSPKGADVLPVLLTLIHFGSKWGAETGPSRGELARLGDRFDMRYYPGGAGPEQSSVHRAASRN